jgi:hypothetical protein
MQIHKFEFAGLGQAPFRVVGLFSFPSKSLAEHNPNAYNNHMQSIPKDVVCGSCAFCHTALTHNYIVQSADGKKFVVGSDCVKKTGDLGLAEQIKLIDRQLRTEARMKAMEADAKAKLNKERDANGGLTNEEMFQLKKAEILKAREPIESLIVEKLSPFTKALNQANGPFAHDMLVQLSQCNLDLTSRTVRIIIDIAAKAAGRANSKAYNQRFEELEILWDEINIIYQSMPKLP